MVKELVLAGEVFELVESPASAEKTNNLGELFFQLREMITGANQETDLD